MSTTVTVFLAAMILFGLKVFLTLSQSPLTPSSTSNQQQNLGPKISSTNLPKSDEYNKNINSSTFFTYSKRLLTVKKLKPP